MRGISAKLFSPDGLTKNCVNIRYWIFVFHSMLDVHLSKQLSAYKEANRVPAVNHACLWALGGLIQWQSRENRKWMDVSVVV